MIKCSKALALCGLLLTSCAAKTVELKQNPPKPSESKPLRTIEESRALFTAWNKITKPMPGEATAYGTYTAGCLRGAVALPKDGEGYQVMRLGRNRYWGHPNLVNYIKSLATKLASISSERMPLMLVGDMAQPRGGPMFSGHASHQMGLDVDIWYTMLHKRLDWRERANLSASDHVSPEGKLQDWKPIHTKLVAAAAEAEEVERVFVHAAIKKYFCEAFPGAPWLYKLRAWWGHDDHLHVRLRCPKGDLECKHQDELDPKQLGCGEELNWWFTDEAKEEFAKRMKELKEKEFPDVPQACLDMAK
jgi:penicillin-insensitive murein endopeptidase